MISFHSPSSCNRRSPLIRHRLSENSTAQCLAYLFPCNIITCNSPFIGLVVPWEEATRWLFCSDNFVTTRWHPTQTSTPASLITRSLFFGCHTSRVTGGRNRQPVCVCRSWSTASYATENAVTRHIDSYKFLSEKFGRYYKRHKILSRQNKVFNRGNSQ